jgi:hypothetical protein
MSSITPSDTSTSFCACGALVPIGSPAETAHYVWAVRPTSGARSNIGYCPVIRGMDAAMDLACSIYGQATYFGRAVS